MICLELEKPFLQFCSSAKLSLTSGGQKSASLWGFSDFWMTCSTCSELLCSHQRIHLSQLFSNVREQRCCQVPWSISMPFRLLQIINCNKERKVLRHKKVIGIVASMMCSFGFQTTLADVPIQVLFFEFFEDKNWTYTFTRYPSACQPMYTMSTEHQTGTQRRGIYVVRLRFPRRGHFVLRWRAMRGQLAEQSSFGELSTSKCPTGGICAKFKPPEFLYPLKNCNLEHKPKITRNNIKRP